MISMAGLKHRCSPCVLGSPFSGNHAVDGSHMLKQRLSNPRKRQRSEQYLPQQNRTSQPLSKRQKHSHPPIGSHPPPAFWDNLSMVWLTKGALRELDRRNALSQSAPSLSCSLHKRSHRPFTQHAVAKVDKSYRYPQSASEFLCHCTTESLKDIKRLARHGGPDLLELRGVRTA